MTRRHSGSDSEAFNANPDTGRRGFRYEWEAPDDRPLVVQTDLWEDETQRMTYEAACEADKPREADTLDGYLARISAAVEGRYKRLPVMPQGLRQSKARRLEASRRKGMPAKMEIL